MTENRGDPVAIYWKSVAEVAAQPEAIYTAPEEQQRRRAIELQRLRELADRYRELYFPKLPAVTIEAVKMGGRTSASVDPLGGWGQGIAIKVKSTRIDPFRWEPAAERFQDGKTIVKTAKDKSLLFGFKLRECPAGETIRKLEAELLVLQQLLRAEQHRVIEKRDRGFSEAESDVQNWGGNGRWFAQNASTIWKRWCADHSVPFVPCRHSRANYEQDHPTVDHLEHDVEDAILTHLRPSCSGWPYICLKQNREPIAEGACPKTVGTGDAATVVTPETWERWKVEQQQLTGAVVTMIGSDALLWGVAWPQGERPVIDELEGDPIVAMPLIEKPTPTSTKVTIPFNAGGAAQALEHVLQTAEQEHAIKGLWTETLQVLANHPDCPGASRVQTELDTAPSIEIESRDTTGEPTVEHWRPILEGIADLVPWVNSWSLSCGGSTALGLDSTLTRKTDRGYSTPYPPQGAPFIDIEWARANGQKTCKGKLGKVGVSKTAMGPFNGDLGAPPEWTELAAAINNRAKQLLTPIDAGPICSLIKGDNSDLIRACADLYLTPEDKIADLTFGKGVFWRKCPELNVTGSDLETVPERAYDFRKTPYDDGSFDVAVLDPPYIHSWSTHQTEGRYRGSTTHATSMAGIWELYREGMTEACRITRKGGRILVKTKDTVESGRQRWSHIHLAQVGEQMGLYLRDLMVLHTAPPCEKRWEGTEQKHSRKDISYLLVFERNGKVLEAEPTPIDAGQVDLAEVIAAQFNTSIERAAGVADRIKRFLTAPTEETAPTPIEAEPDPALKAVKSEPMVNATIDGFYLEQEVSHEALGRGVIIRLFSPVDGGCGTAAIDLNGTPKIVKLDDLTPIEAGELPVDEAVVQATERDDQGSVTGGTLTPIDGGQTVPKPPAKSNRATKLKGQSPVKIGPEWLEVTAAELQQLRDQAKAGDDDAREKVNAIDAHMVGLGRLVTGKYGQPATAQSELRKRPATGQRNRLTRAETTELHQRLRIALTTHQGNNRELAVQLAPELGLNVQMLTNHISKVRKQAA